MAMSVSYLTCSGPGVFVFVVWCECCRIPLACECLVAAGAGEARSGGSGARGRLAGVCGIKRGPSCGDVSCQWRGAGGSEDEIVRHRMQQTDSSHLLQSTHQ